MLDALSQASSQLWRLDVVLAVLAAVPIGVVFGLLPGLGGLSTLALLLPVVYGMEPMVGLAFLLAAHAVVYTGGALSAVLLGIPGAPANAASVVDGISLTRAGRGATAVGAALAASALGGIAGFAALSLLLPFARTWVTWVGSPETFMLALLGLSCVAVIGGQAMLKGLIAGTLGVFLSLFGYQATTGIPRFWFGVDYLLDGFALIPLALGLFALPEIVSLCLRDPRHQSLHDPDMNLGSVREGFARVLRRRWLCLRSSLIGVLVGIVPGVGGETAPFVAYAMAKRRAGPGGRFGRGALDGVIAAESSNNAKEGGALLPTLALGVPGSAGMALLLAGFMLLGLEPGPRFLLDHMDLALALAAILAIANVLAVVCLAAGSRWLVRIAAIRGPVLAPLLLVLVVVGAHASSNNPLDVLAMLGFGVLGWCLRACGYSRAAVLLGFVLGGLLETYLHISISAYGPAFLLRPACLGLMAAILAVLVLTPRWRRDAGAGAA